MDRETISQQMKALKKKAKDTKAKGEKVVAAQYAKASSRLWRRLQRMAPAVAEKISEG